MGGRSEGSGIPFGIIAKWNSNRNGSEIVERVAVLYGLFVAYGWSGWSTEQRRLYSGGASGIVLKRNIYRKRTKGLNE